MRIKAETHVPDPTPDWDEVTVKPVLPQDIVLLRFTRNREVMFEGNRWRVYANGHPSYFVMSDNDVRELAAELLRVLHNAPRGMSSNEV